MKVSIFQVLRKKNGNIFLVNNGQVKTTDVIGCRMKQSLQNGLNFENLLNLLIKQNKRHFSDLILTKTGKHGIYIGKYYFRTVQINENCT